MLLQMFADPYDGTLQCLQKYGDPMTCPGFGTKFFVTADPDAIKTILTADADTYQPTNTETLGTFLGPGSLFMMSGATHRAARKLLTPPFHGARMRAYGALMRDITLRYVQTWQPGRRFAMQDTTPAITLDIIIAAIFGVSGAARIRRFHEAIVGTVASISPFIVMLKFLRRKTRRLPQPHRVSSRAVPRPELLAVRIPAVWRRGAALHRVGFCPVRDEDRAGHAADKKSSGACRNTPGKVRMSRRHRRT